VLRVVLVTVATLLTVQEVKQQNKVLFSIALLHFLFSETKEEITFV